MRDASRDPLLFAFGSPRGLADRTWTSLANLDKTAALRVLELSWPSSEELIIVYEPTDEGIRVARLLHGARNLAA